MIVVTFLYLFLLCLAMFSVWMLQTEYTFYWLIRDASLPSNISAICSGNISDAMCEIYEHEVVKTITNYNMYSALISLITLSFTCWMCTLSDLIGRRTILFVNQLGSFGACCIATHVMFFQLHPMWFLIGSFFLLFVWRFCSVTGYCICHDQFPFRPG